MKCRFVRDVDVDTSTLPAHERELLSFRPGKPGPVAYFAAGTVREGEVAEIHCRAGIAEPADEECAVAVGLTEAQLKGLQAKYDKVAKGIHPDDYELYDAGVIVGYNEDGSHKPGPKWDEYHAALQTEDDAEGDE